MGLHPCARPTITAVSVLPILVVYSRWIWFRRYLIAEYHAGISEVRQQVHLCCCILCGSRSGMPMQRTGYVLSCTILILYKNYDFMHDVSSLFSCTGETVTCLAHKGLVCQNAKQSDGNCLDYRVRFLCPAGTIQDTAGISCSSHCETLWLDRDDPSKTCDCETIRDFSPSLVCPNPIGIKCRERSTGQDYLDIGQTMTCDVQTGGLCLNIENFPDTCRDYEVQFICSEPCWST